MQNLPSWLRHWIHRFRGELWIIPAALVICALGLAELAVGFEAALADGRHVPLFFRGTAASGQVVLSTIATSILSLAALVFSISMVVLQLTSQQFSPRALRRFNRDPRTQIVLGIFVATFLYSLLALGALGDAPSGESAGQDRVTVTFGLALALVSLGAFIFHVHHISQAIRVAHIIEAIAEETRGCIDASFPLAESPREPLALPIGAADRAIAFERRSGAVTAVWFEDLAELCRRKGCVMRLLPEVGEYVPRGAPLCEVWGGSAPSPAEVSRLVEIEIERAVRLDVAFGLRQLVDIAAKALSPAVNDPTTAVQVIDRLTDLLVRLAPRGFPRGAVLDREGAPRVFYEPVTWDALVQLAYDELRDYGVDSRQVARRLRASLASVHRAAPPARQFALRRQFELLDAELERRFPHPGDRAERMIADDLGLGGER